MTDFNDLMRRQLAERNARSRQLLDRITGRPHHEPEDDDGDRSAEEMLGAAMREAHTEEAIQRDLADLDDRMTDLAQRIKSAPNYQKGSDDATSEGPAAGPENAA